MFNRNKCMSHTFAHSIPSVIVQRPFESDIFGKILRWEFLSLLYLKLKSYLTPIDIVWIAPIQNHISTFRIRSCAFIFNNRLFDLGVLYLPWKIAQKILLLISKIKINIYYFLVEVASKSVWRDLILLWKNS